MCKREYSKKWLRFVSLPTCLSDFLESGLFLHVSYVSYRHVKHWSRAIYCRSKIQQESSGTLPQKVLMFHASLWPRGIFRWICSEILSLHCVWGEWPVDLARCLSGGASRNEKWNLRAYRVLVPCGNLEISALLLTNKQKLEDFPVKFPYVCWESMLPQLCLDYIV